jgi:RimJ/RimL family protein N-acetyltransferase
MEPAVIQTARLRLRPWREEDKPPFRALNADPRVMACFPSVLSASQSDALAERFQKFIEAQGWGFWAVECNATQAFIGFVGLHAQPDALPFPPVLKSAGAWPINTGGAAMPAKPRPGRCVLDSTNCYWTRSSLSPPSAMCVHER